MQNYEFEDVLVGLLPSGCVQPYIQDFVAALVEDGYTLLSTRDYVRSAAHLGRWMDAHRIGVRELEDSTVADFARHPCKCPGIGLRGRRPSRRYVARLRRFVDYLRGIGVLPGAVPSPTQAVPPLVMEFREWMLRHRGLKQPTIERYEYLVLRMLPALGEDPGSYDASLVRRVFLDQVRDLGRVYAKTFVTALRAFLRFLAAEGHCRPHLDRAVPTIPEWRLSALPRYIDATDVERVIASCDSAKPHGVRDRAILLLLARLGLRAGDIVAMKFDDLDWKAGTVRVRGKGRREVRLPLSQDVGDAILDYLAHARPADETDRVFLCAQAPLRPFTKSSMVSDIVRLALRRAGITDPPSKGAHLLRHSAATTMLRAGASLDVIATVLRHSSTDTTAYYAKVDVDLLQLIAQPWPEVHDAE